MEIKKYMTSIKTKFYFIMMLIIIMHCLENNLKVIGSIIISLGPIRISLIIVNIIILLLFLIIAYKTYKQKDINPFYIFFFSLLCILSSFCLFITYMQIFVFPNNFEKTFDYIINISLFKIQVEYTEKYKLNFMQSSLQHLINIVEVSFEKKKLLQEILKNVPDQNQEILIKDPQKTLNDIKSYLLICMPFYSFYADFIQQNIDYLLSIYDVILPYNSTYYQMFSLIRNVLLISAFVKTVFFIIPTYILDKYLEDFLVTFVRAQLQQYITFLMTPEEVSFFCWRGARWIIQNKSSLYIIVKLGIFWVTNKL